MTALDRLQPASELADRHTTGLIDAMQATVQRYNIVLQMRGVPVPSWVPADYISELAHAFTLFVRQIASVAGWAPNGLI